MRSSLLTLTPTTRVTLAQQGAPPASIWVWIAVLLGVAIVGGIVIMLLRRRLLGDDPVASETGIMDDLRRMRDSGELSEAEFKAARDRIVARAAGKAPPERSGPGPGFDLTGDPLPPRPPRSDEQDPNMP